MDNEITNISTKVEEPHKYVTKAKPVMIHFISRASVKIQDNFYTIEYGEDRQVDFDEVNINKERQALIDDCNYEVDKQIEEILKTFAK